MYFQAEHINNEETVLKKEEITGEDALLDTPEIEQIYDKTITVKHEREEEGIKTEVDPLSATMDQDPLADAVKQEEDVLDIKIEFAEA